MKTEIIEIYKNVLGNLVINEGVLENSLDSIEIMEIVVSLEEKFDIEFETDELDEDIFINLNEVYFIINNKIKNHM